jgi:hypothetical protein
VSRERDRREDPQRNRADACEGGNDRARLERGVDVPVREEVVVPAEGEAGEREDRHRRLVEGEDEKDRDRRVQEHDHECEERTHDAPAVTRERDVHQAIRASPARR